MHEKLAHKKAYEVQVTVIRGAHSRLEKQDAKLGLHKHNATPQANQEPRLTLTLIKPIKVEECPSCTRLLMGKS